MAVVASRVDGPAAVRGRLEAFASEVLADAVNRPVQAVNGGLYVRGLLEEGQRKSLEPLVERLGGEAEYQSMQQFLADSPWDAGLVVRAVAQRVVAVIGVQAWVLDDTGFPKQGKDSPGVKAQYSGSLGHVGNCQVGVSVHAVGSEGTVPLGWALYLPPEWCDDVERRRRGKIPEQVGFKTKPELGIELIERAAGWEIGTAPVLGDQAYGESIKLRDRLDQAGCEYVLAVGSDTSVFDGETVFAVPAKRKGARTPFRAHPDRDPEQVHALCERLGAHSAQTVMFRDGPAQEPVSSRFLLTRVRIARAWNPNRQQWRICGGQIPREEWLIAEWPNDSEKPTDYWLSNLPADTEPEQLARLARLRWKIELDYKQLKGELGLDHYEGRSWLGWYHHTALVTAAHGFLTLERLNPFRPRPA